MVINNGPLSRFAAVIYYGVDACKMYFYSCATFSKPGPLRISLDLQSTAGRQYLTAPCMSAPSTAQSPTLSGRMFHQVNGAYINENLLLGLFLMKTVMFFARRLARRITRYHHITESAM